MSTLIFDLDGPILDNRKKHYSVYVSIILLHGGTPLSLSKYWSLKQNRTPIADILQFSHVHISVDTFLSQFITAIESKTFLTYDVLQPKTVTTLKELKKRGYELWLVTSRNIRSNLLWQLDQLKLKHYFTYIISPQTPSQELLPKITLFQVDFKSSSLIGVIGDTEADEALADDLNVPFYAVTTGIRKKDLLHTNHYIKNISELLVLIPLLTQSADG
jgi:phosphoglycolate phosphatase-like HAD superfamily hydrolase